MRRAPLLAALVALILAVGNAPPLRAQTVAVQPLEFAHGLPAYAWLSDYLARALTVEVAKIDGVRVVDRTSMEAILQEIEFGYSSLADRSAAVRFEGFAVADHLLTGQYAVRRDRVDIDILLLSVRSGEVLLGLSESAPATELQAVTERVADGMAAYWGKARRGVSAAAPRGDLAALRVVDRAEALHDELPFHALHPRRRRMLQDFLRTASDLETVMMQGYAPPRVVYLAGVFYLQSEEWERARSYFEALADPDSGDPSFGLVGLGDLARFRHDFHAAERSYRRALEHEPAAAGAHYGLALCAEAYGNRIETAYHLLRLAEIEPHHRFLLRRLQGTAADLSAAAGSGRLSIVADALRGIQLLEAGRPSEAARQLARAGELFPDLYLVPFAEGLSHLSARSLGPAERALRHAWSLNPTYPPVHKALGELSVLTGQCRPAVDHLQTYLYTAAGGEDFATVRAWIRSCGGTP